MIIILIAHDLFCRYISKYTKYVQLIGSDMENEIKECLKDEAGLKTLREVSIITTLGDFSVVKSNVWSIASKCTGSSRSSSDLLPLAKLSIITI